VPPKDRPRKSLTREAWEDAALLAIAEGGPEAVMVEPLARRLGVTKGSFYWHFADRGELLESALHRWERRGTSDLLARLEREVPDPRQRIRMLLHEGIETGVPTVLARLLAAADDEPAAAATLERITQARLAFVERALQESGHSPQQAKERALVGYAAYLGFAFLRRQVDALATSQADKAAFAERIAASLLDVARSST
jgi:AcrR family transcriptional regulator